MLLTLSDQQRSTTVSAFELKHMVSLSNTTKNRLMMPLRLDNAVLTSRHAAVANNNEVDGSTPSSSQPPRGIVLNTAVGGLTFAGGLMGFVTKGSKASLIAGSTFGGLLMLSAFLISKSSKSKSAKGNILGSSVAAMLGYVMGKKFLVSRKFMPSGLLAFLSVVGVVYNVIEVKILSSTSASASTTSSVVKEDSSTTESTEDTSAEDPSEPTTSTE